MWTPFLFSICFVPWQSGQLAESLALFGRWLGDAPYFGGERPLFSDYYALSVVDEAGGFFPAALERAPALAAYRRRMYARPGLAAYAVSGRQSAWYGFDPARGLRPLRRRLCRPVGDR